MTKFTDPHKYDHREKKCLKNRLILSLIPLKMVESKYFQENNLQDSNSSSNCLLEQGKESATPRNASRKNVEEVFVEKTKINESLYKTIKSQYKTRK